MSQFVYGLHTITVRTTPLFQTCELAAQVGFQALELHDETLDRFIKEEGSIDDLLVLRDDLNLQFVSLRFPNDWAQHDQIAGTPAAESLNRSFELASRLACPILSLSPPRFPVVADRAAQLYAEIAAIGRGFGVRPALEFSGLIRSGDLRTFSGVHATVEAASCPEEAVVLDIFHLVRGGGDIEDISRIRADQLATVHLNDMPGTPVRSLQDDTHRVMPGEGKLNLQRVIDQLQAIEYEGPVTLEVSADRYWNQDPHEVIRRGYFRMRTLLET